MAGNGTLPTRGPRFECPEGYGRDCCNPLCDLKYAEQDARDELDRMIGVTAEPICSIVDFNARLPFILKDMP